jgi:hypothetical protein
MRQSTHLVRSSLQHAPYQEVRPQPYQDDEEDDDALDRILRPLGTHNHGIRMNDSSGNIPNLPNHNTRVPPAQNDRHWLSDLERMVDDLSVSEPEGRRQGETVDHFAQRIHEMLRPVMSFQQSLAQNRHNLYRGGHGNYQEDGEDGELDHSSHHLHQQEDSTLIDEILARHHSPPRRNLSQVPILGHMGGGMVPVSQERAM